MELKSLLCEATSDAVKLLQSDECFPAAAPKEKPAALVPPDPATSRSEHSAFTRCTVSANLHISC